MTDHNEEQAWAEQKALLKRHFDPVTTEPIPARMYLRQPAWIGLSRAAIVFTLGLAVGIGAMVTRDQMVVTAGGSDRAIAVRAARAHAIYSTEVRHPVEVDARQQDHLVKWLSKRVGLDLKVPHLASEGYELLGGRLLPGPEGAVAQFMYQDGAGKRLTYYVARRNVVEPLTAFRFAKQGNVSVFYWIDNECGYAISAEIDKPALARIANVIYKQVEDDDH